MNDQTTTLAPEVTFGQAVTFTWHVERQTEHRPVEGDKYRRDERWRVWKPRAYPGQPEPAPTPGIVVGVRTLANGPTAHDYEAGTYFEAHRAERFKAYLVAYDLRRKPVLVLPEHLTASPDGDQT